MASLRWWPWAAKPGHVRIGRKDWTRLLEEANRALELEAERDRLRAESARLCAESAARALVEVQCRAAGVRFTPLAVDGLVADLSIHADGRLHVEAFLALLGQHLLEHRLGDSIPTTSTGGDHR